MAEKQRLQNELSKIGNHPAHYIHQQKGVRKNYGISLFKMQRQHGF